jgi:hypothetical protein
MLDWPTLKCVREDDVRLKKRIAIAVGAGEAPAKTSATARPPRAPSRAKVPWCSMSIEICALRKVPLRRKIGNGLDIAHAALFPAPMKPTSSPA